MAKQAVQSGDDGTNDMLVGDVIRPNELQVWFLAEHLVDAPFMRQRCRLVGTLSGWLASRLKP